MLRIIGGEFRSRHLQSVPGTDVRPTPDRMRESLFSILAPTIETGTFLDAYAGTGAVGLEAVSRGAPHAVLVEKDPKALAVLRANVESLAVAARVTVVKGKAVSAIRDHPSAVLFVDPPYHFEDEYKLAMTAAALSGRHPLVIAQHDRRLVLPEQYSGLVRYRSLKQGDNVLSFYRLESSPAVL